MAHLPNEIWLHILTFSNPTDLWRGLRNVNRQLQACVEQHFEEEYLPHVAIELPVTLPTYDIRAPIRGKVVFHHLPKERYPDSAANRPGEAGRKLFYLVETDPEFYRPHFLVRWDGMRKNHEGKLNEKMCWELRLATRNNGLSLRDAIVEDSSVDDAVLSFEWKASLTTFFRQWNSR